jgi:hypoxanthine phosphoribosyltransferase
MTGRIILDPIGRRQVSRDPYNYSARKSIHPLSWEDFHGLCKALAVAAAGFRPEIVLPIGRGGYPIRLSRRVNDAVTYKSPKWIIEPPAVVAGRNVLIVDEVCSSGETISMAKDKIAELGASGTKSAVLYAHTWSTDIPDYIGLITDALVLNPWDREILRDGTFRFNPEYVDALAHQGLKAETHMLIPATEIRLAKS